MILRLRKLFLLIMTSFFILPAVGSAEEQTKESLLQKAEELAREARTLSERSKMLSDEAQKLIERALSLSEKPEQKQTSPQKATQEKTSTEPAEAKQALKQEKARQEQERKQKQLAAGNNILFPKGFLEIEPSFTYANFSNNNLLIDGFALLPIFVIGQIQSQRIRRDLLVESLNVSYGVLDNVQIQMESPLRFRSDDITYSDNTNLSAKRAGLGDIRLGTSVQLHQQKESDFIPDLIGNLNVFFPTGEDPFNYDPAHPKDKNIPLGSGFWSIGTGLTMIKVSDPAVLLGGINYTYNFPRSIDGEIIRGRVTPGILSDILWGWPFP